MSDQQTEQVRYSFRAVIEIEKIAVTTEALGNAVDAVANAALYGPAPSDGYSNALWLLGEILKEQSQRLYQLIDEMKVSANDD